MKILRLESRRDDSGYFIDCVCGRRLFRYTLTALTAAKTDHLKREHARRYWKGGIK